MPRQSWSRSFAFLLVAVGAFAAACVSEEPSAESSGAAVQREGTTLLDVNDVSILFPAQGHAFFPQIPVTQGELWDAQNFDLVMAAAKASTIEPRSNDAHGYPLEAAHRANWRVVSLRFDPCAPGLSAVRADTTGARFDHQCHVQLRLVAEPKPLASDFVGASDDFAAHLIYDLVTLPVDAVAADPLVRAIVNRLVDIKRVGARDGESLDVTSGAPLGAHPKLARRDAAAERAARAIEQLIFDVTQGKVANDGKARPVQRRIAFMGLRQAGEEWVFLSGKMNERGLWEQSPRLPKLPPPVVDKFSNPNGRAFQALTSTGEIVDGPEPKPVDAVASTAEFYAGGGTPDVRAQLFQIENPAIVDVFSTDCVSCHTASVAKSESKDLGTTEGEKRARMAIPPFITGYIAQGALQKKDYAVHAFGTFLGPSVSGRTLNETVEVVSYINDEILQAGVTDKQPGPGLLCPDDLGVQLCLMSDDAKNCFAPCRKSR